MSTAEALDIAWILLCAGLVMFMQPGFSSLETGLVRTKNSINVAAKNFVDFCVTSGIYWGFGFAFMFGASVNGWLGFSLFALSDTSNSWMVAFFLFQLGFASTATTIMSGAVAERMRFYAYLTSALIMSSLIYPIFGHWAWGSTAGGNGGWLEALGFIDFAGSTVVHSIGGWMALASILILGPRFRRFGKNAVPIQGHDLPVVTLGVFILWFGWIGFNGGSTLGLTSDVPGIILNTFISGSFGGLVALVISELKNNQVDVPMMMNGGLAGLVGVTASANMVTPVYAVIIGIVSGIVMYAVSLLLEKFEIDDAVGAVPVHLAAGIWGTLAVALFADPSYLGGISRLSQLSIQAIGVLAAFVWSFGLGFTLLYLVNKRFPLRVDPEGERIGLNVAEHGASTAILDLLTEMDDQRKNDDFTNPVNVEPHTEVGQIAQQYNLVLEDINKQTSALRLMQRTAAAANEARTIEGAMETVITEVCLETNWDVGHAYLVDPNDPQVLAPTSTWYLKNPARYREFRDQWDQIQFRSVEGIPGQVFANGEPVWEKISSDGTKNYHDELIKEYNLKSQLATPVLVGQEVAAVLEFFSEQELEKDSDLLSVMVAVGTELGRVVERTRSEEQRFQTIVDNMPAMVMLRDLSGKFILVNKSYEDFYQLAHKNVLGKNISEVNALTDVEINTKEIIEQDVNVIQKNITIENELTITRDGCEHTLASIKFPIPDHLGQVVAVGGFELDISERKQYEAELAELVRTIEIARDRAIDATQAKSRFLANMTHELRTPLNAIIGYTQIVKRRSDEILAQQDSENLDKVLIRSKHLLGLINEILDLSRIESGKQEIHPVKVNLPELIGSCIATVEPLVQSQRVTIKNETKNDILNLRTDEDKLRQILINLLSNAVKFTLEGSITVSAEVISNRVYISIADTGIGIEESKLDKIFEEFYMGKQIKDQPGTGLGLTISKQLAQLLGGDITVASTVDVGSTFTVDLPIKIEDRSKPDQK